ncbi:ImmA/IrrE family metallo-endopeptidase [Caloranaerobacter sp. DY30410]|uniref:ImmA/IrrE family metallo-endopeptidase n=1 Tax=Caloranaerobacter sp. DY30410 TaxID=3238305 RepID=UPI003D05E309
MISRIELGHEKIDAFSQWIGSRPFIFLGSDKDSAVRSRFDIAHELGHLLLHTHVDQEDLKDPKVLKRIEKEAHYFVGAFLLPEDSFAQEVTSISIDHFISLKKRWKVSIASMIYRCDELGIFTDNKILYLNKQMSYRKMRKKNLLMMY